MIERSLLQTLKETLEAFPVVGLLGARQVGKTTLARALAESMAIRPLFLDLERPSDLAKLADPEFYLGQHRDRLVVLDEIQRIPELFPVLRALVDEHRRPGRFLVLGSASAELAQQASESLAGRIRYLELGPLSLQEVGEDKLQSLWLRGGFPESFLARSAAASAEWREAFTRTFLERDIPALGLRLPAAQLRRFWLMVAHRHGQLWNASELAASLDLSAPTVRRHLDLLVDTFMVRQLPPFHANLGKRLVKRPKVYLRDSGLLHTLLGIETLEDLLGHPVAGASWEGFVLEQALGMLPSAWKPSFYRTSGGAELDLVLERPRRKKPLGIEIKLSSAPVPSKGFWNALADLGAEGAILANVKEAYALAPQVRVFPVSRIADLFELF